MGTDVGKPQRIIGRYALHGALSSGGMATVHLGRLLGPVGFSRTIAIKRLHDQFATDPEFVSSFLDEARLAARIRHPNVVPTLDVVATDGQLFLVMEYIQGESLSRLLRTLASNGERVPPRIALGIIAGVLHGLHAAHEAKNESGESLHIVHRDMSPQNVMVGVDGVPRVVDFGIAKASGRLQNTRDGQLKGKLAYMPPEQIEGGSIDRRADIYSTSVVAWETLTAKRLFAAENEGAVLGRLLDGAKEPPSTYAPDAAPLDAIVMRGLHRDPSERWPTARDMALALEEAMPPATAAQIGAWVERVAADVLSARATVIAEIESGSISGERMSTILSEIQRTGSSDPLPETAATSQSHSVSTPPRAVPPASPRRWAVVIALGAAVLGASGVVAYTKVRRSEHDRAAIQPSTAAVEVAAPVPLSSLPSVTSGALAPLSPVPSAASTVSEPSAAPSSPRPASTHRSAPRAATSAPAAASSIDCTNAFTFDAMGRKIYKKECLQ